MPRPYKDWLDYFPLDTDFFSNKKIKDLRRKKGTVGIITYLNLLCKIYRGGYFYTFEDLEELSRDIAEEIADVQLERTSSKITEVIHYLVGRGILDEGLFKRNVISGISMQEQYILSMHKRKRKINMDVHLLVDVDAVIAKIKKNSEETEVNSEETEVNSEENEVNSENGTQRKGKETKPNNGKETRTPPRERASAPVSENPDFEELYKAYPRKDMKEEAQATYERINPSFEEYVQMLDAILVQEKSEAWTEQNGRFIPNLPKWLESRQWANTPIVKATKECDFMDNLSEASIERFKQKYCKGDKSNDKS